MHGRLPAANQSRRWRESAHRSAEKHRCGKPHADVGNSIAAYAPTISEKDAIFNPTRRSSTETELIGSGRRSTSGANTPSAIACQILGSRISSPSNISGIGLPATSSIRWRTSGSPSKYCLKLMVCAPTNFRRTSASSSRRRSRCRASLTEPVIPRALSISVAISANSRNRCNQLSAGGSPFPSRAALVSAMRSTFSMKDRVCSISW